MKCPYCLSNNTFVVDSRESKKDGSVRRRRECSVCHRRFSTIETLEYQAITVIKKSGRHEPFSEAKLRKSINTALSSMIIDNEKKEELFSNLTLELYKKALEHRNVLTSTEIGDAALQSLKSVSQIAYIRFASVYKEFSDVKQIIEEIKRL